MNFAFFASKRNARKCEIHGENIFFRSKCEIFVKRFPLFAGNPNIEHTYITTEVRVNHIIVRYYKELVSKA